MAGLDLFGLDADHVLGYALDGDDALSVREKFGGTGRVGHEPEEEASSDKIQKTDSKEDQLPALEAGAVGMAESESQQRSYHRRHAVSGEPQAHS